MVGTRQPQGLFQRTRLVVAAVQDGECRARARLGDVREVGRHALGLVLAVL